MDSYRSVLEVLRWTSPKEVLKDYSLLCATWRRAADSSELWTSFCEDANLEIQDHDRKSLYRDNQPVIKELPGLRGNVLKLIHPATLQVKKVTLKEDTDLTICGSWCFIKSDTILSFGGGSISNCVWAINTVTGEVTSRAPMYLERNNPGLLKYRNFVYVFGGMHLRSAEKYDFLLDKWVLLKTRMVESADHFMPSRCKQNVYIVKWFVQVFNMETEKFKKVNLKLPFRIGRNFISAEDGTLLLLAAGYLMTAKLPNPALELEEVTRLDWDYHFTNTPYIWKSGKLYFIRTLKDYDFTLFRVDMEKRYACEVLTF